MAVTVDETDTAVGCCESTNRKRSSSSLFNTRNIKAALINIFNAKKNRLCDVKDVAGADKFREL